MTPRTAFKSEGLCIKAGATRNGNDTMKEARKCLSGGWKGQFVHSCAVLTRDLMGCFPMKADRAHVVFQRAWPAATCLIPPLLLSVKYGAFELVSYSFNTPKVSKQVAALFDFQLIGRCSAMIVELCASVLLLFSTCFTLLFMTGLHCSFQW